MYRPTRAPLLAALFLLLGTTLSAQMEVEIEGKSRAPEERFSDVDKETGELLSPNLNETSDEAHSRPGLPDPTVPLYRRNPPEQVIVGEVGDAYRLTRRELEKMVEARYGKIDIDVDDPYRARHREKVLSRAESELLMEWAVLKTLAVKARQAGIRVSPEEAEAQLGEVGERYLKEGGLEDVQRSARIVGIDAEQLRREITDGLLVDKFLARELGRQFDEQALEEIYNRAPARYATPRSYKVREIFKRIEPEMSREEVRDIRKELYQNRKEVAKSDGKRFSEIAAEESDKPQARETGGLLGWISAATPMPEELIREIIELEPGEVSDIIESEAGYHVFLVEEIREATGVTFDAQARERVLNELAAGYKQRYARAILKSADFPVRMNPGGLRLVGQPAGS